MKHSRPSIPRPILLAMVPHLRGLPMTQEPQLSRQSKLNCIRTLEKALIESPS